MRWGFYGEYREGLRFLCIMARHVMVTCTVSLHRKIQKVAECKGAVVAPG